jgi:predicted  nucleic acid-binding Zn-ribbon protein
MENELGSLKKVLSDKDSRVIELKNTLIPASFQVLESARQKIKEYDSMQNRVDQLSIQKDIMKKNCESLAASIEILDETDLELEKMLNLNSQKLETEESGVAALESRKSGVTENLAQQQQQLSRMLTLQGQYQAEKNVILGNAGI